MKKIFVCLLFLIINYTLIIDDCTSQWYIQLTPQKFLNSISFLNSNTGYVVGDSGTMYKTTNSGANWYLQYTGITFDIKSVKFLNLSTGFLTGGIYGGSFNYGYILKTTNGGTNWVGTVIDSIYFENSLFFINSSTGYIGGWGGSGGTGNRTKIYKTTNGGDNWYPTIVNNVNSIRNIFFINDNTGWGVGDYYNPTSTEVIIKTTNSGNNWLIIDTISNSWLSSVFFVNANTGWIIGENQLFSWTGLIRKTTNGGFNWVVQNQPYAGFLYKGYFLNENLGWVVGESGTVLKTYDGGVNWNMQTSHGYWFNDVFFLDSNTGWCAGDRIINTTNGGGAFSTFSISGTVRYTDNNQPVTSGVVKAIKLNQNDASIIVYDTALIQSNGTYILPNVPQDSVYIGLYPNSSTTPDYVISYYPSATDWHQATGLYPTSNLTNIDLGAIRIQSTTANNSVNGKVMRLTNSMIGNLKDAVLYAKNGNSFVRCSTSDVNGVYHLPSLPTGNLKIIVNRLGFSNDSTTVNVTSTSNIDSINFYVFRNYTGIIPITGVVPTDFKLYQNYPNPFNPVTKIKFDIAVHSVGQTFLSVYDLLGREIVTLVNEKLTPGTYEVTFDGSKYASGVYFYQLRTGDFVNTKRLVMIK